jgi:hypothetical protein
VVEENMEITWTRSGATTPGGFVSDLLGYRFFLKPEISQGIILWHGLSRAVVVGTGWEVPR